jgi:hypothetical protein
MKHSYDPKCEELAIYFLSEVSHPSRQEIAELAQVIQDAIEDELHVYEELGRTE